MHTDVTSLLVVCINQDDIDERNCVVRRMKDIYERAHNILAWLGPEGDDGAAALLAGM
jgi:hypothetical protein